MFHRVVPCRVTGLRPLTRPLASDASDLSHGKLGEFDVVIVGGGIVGLATGLRLISQKRDLTVAVVEKESTVAAHQSSRNSGVVHAGIYYTPGSDKAKLCTEGMKSAYKYFDSQSIPYKKVGKLIVATSPAQLPALCSLYERGLANQVPDLEIVSEQRISEIEPNCVGIKAIHSPHTGIVDWGYVAKAFAKDFRQQGGYVHCNFTVNDFTFDDDPVAPVVVKSAEGEIVRASTVLCCGGLHADRLAEMTGGCKTPAIVPFRGEYLMLKPEKQNLIKGNIYPVPDLRFPFLGVHFTPRLDGSVLLGPNAVPAFSREGYSYSDVSFEDFVDIITYTGFRKIALKHYKFGLSELLKSFFIRLQLRELRKFIPTLQIDDICRGPTGVRSQALSNSGELVEDFLFEVGGKENRVLHCRNAPSPAATSSLAIGRVLSEKIVESLVALNHPKL